MVEWWHVARVRATKGGGIYLPEQHTVGLLSRRHGSYVQFYRQCGISLVDGYFCNRFLCRSHDVSREIGGITQRALVEIRTVGRAFYRSVVLRLGIHRS